MKEISDDKDELVDQVAARTNLSKDAAAAVDAVFSTISRVWLVGKRFN